MRKMITYKKIRNVKNDYFKTILLIYTRFSWEYVTYDAYTCYPGVKELIEKNNLFQLALPKRKNIVYCVYSFMSSRDTRR